MSGAFIIVTSFGCIAARNSLQTGVIGLSLTYALQLTGFDLIIHATLPYFDEMQAIPMGGAAER